MRILACLVAATAVVGLAVTAGQAQTAAPQAPAAAAPDAAPVPREVRGKQLYVKYGCSECHGIEGQGAGTGPKLGPDPLTSLELIKYVRAPTGVMPAYTQKLLPANQDLIDIQAYLASRPKPASMDALKSLGIQ